MKIQNGSCVYYLLLYIFNVGLSWNVSSELVRIFQSWILECQTRYLRESPPISNNTHPESLEFSQSSILIYKK